MSGTTTPTPTPTPTQTQPEAETNAHQSAAVKEEESEKLGTHVMGSPANPNTHPDNQKAALWQADDHQQLHFNQQQQPTPIPTQPEAETNAHQSAAVKEEESNKWGANPTTHPDNQKAALWQADNHQQLHFNQQQQPYLVHSPVEKPPANPFEAVANILHTWSRKAVGPNIWHNLQTGPSVSGAVCGKIGLTAKAITEGGFESIFKKSFETEANEKLKKSFACYLSTTTGPVAGTLYISTHRVAFCSDRPLSFVAPSGEEAWSYCKVMMPLGRVSAVSPENMRENPNERYIQITTIDEHEFWFMGFVNFEKALHLLLESVSVFKSGEEGGGSVHDPAVPPPVPVLRSGEEGGASVHDPAVPRPVPYAQ